MRCRKAKWLLFMKVYIFPSRRAIQTKVQISWLCVICELLIKIHSPIFIDGYQHFFENIYLITFAPNK